MRTQVNSDKNINVDTRVVHFVQGEVNRVLRRFAGKLTRAEVHLSDVNSHKFGTNDKRCVIEARPARHRPLSATNRAPTVRQAVSGALDKMRSSLETFFGRLRKQGEDTVPPAQHRPAVGRRRAPSTVAGGRKRTGTRRSSAKAKAKARRNTSRRS